MKADLRTALAEHSAFVIGSFGFRHPVELIGVETKSLTTTRPYVDADCPFGLIEPRLAYRDQEPLRRPVFVTDHKEQWAIFESIDNQAVDVADGLVAEIEHVNGADGPASPQFQVRCFHEHESATALFIHAARDRKRRARSPAALPA
jgi:hypothetical protein